MAAPACRRESRAGQRAEGRARAGSAARDERARGDAADPERPPPRVRLRRGGLPQGGAADDTRHPHRRDRSGEGGLGRDRRAGRERRRGRAGRRAPRDRRGDVVRCGGIPSTDVVAARGRDADGRRAGRRDRGSRGGARPDAGAPGPRGRGGRRPQHADGRIARGGEDDARAAAADDPARALDGRSRWKRRSSIPSPDCSVPRGDCSAPVRSARRIIRSRPSGCSAAAARYVRPGEVSLAHHGVLFLDELTEFRRDAVEGLRQPLEDGRVVITRAVGSVEFPARFTLVAAANPCPCGFDGDGLEQCVCRPDRVQLYRNKLSGPLLDRIDIRLRIPRLTKEELLGSSPGEASAVAASKGRGCARPAAPAMGRGWACRATPICPGRSRAGPARCRPSAEDLLTKAVETSGAHGPWLRPCHQGRPDRRRPRRLGPSRGRSPG